eukprot:12323312-Karenia_brevis.AAC.1
MYYGELCSIHGEVKADWMIEIGKVETEQDSDGDTTGARQSRCDAEKFAEMSMCFEEDFQGLGNGKRKASDEINTHRNTGRKKRKGKGKGK